MLVLNSGFDAASRSQEPMPSCLFGNRRRMPSCNCFYVCCYDARAPCSRRKRSNSTVTYRPERRKEGLTTRGYMSPLWIISSIIKLPVPLYRSLLVDVCGCVMCWGFNGYGMFSLPAIGGNENWLWVSLTFKKAQPLSPGNAGFVCLGWLAGDCSYWRWPPGDCFWTNSGPTKHSAYAPERVGDQ